MRIPCILVLSLMTNLSAHAHSVKLSHRGAIPDAKLQSDRIATIARHVMANALSPAKSHTAIEPASIVPSQFWIPNAQIETVNWTEMVGWADDDHAAAFATFLKSCKSIVRGTPPRYEGQSFYAALKLVCLRAVNAPPREPAAARHFFETNFRPMRIAPLGENNGLLTGYYEPVVEGSRVPNAKFTVPLYRMPPDPPNNEPRKYYDRASIEQGALAGRNLELCWLKDTSDLLSAQMEGSVRVKLEDGTVLRLGYGGHNGWPNTPDGRTVSAREAVAKEDKLKDHIRESNAANPKEDKELRRSNQLYVFFRETNLTEQDEPFGAQGISLTPGRSIATDKNIFVYGTPFFIKAEFSIEHGKSATKFRRLMISQDTGGAIIGSARADLYFGSGAGPAHVAARIRHPGQFTILVPREIDPVMAGTHTPLPRPRPAFINIESKLEKVSDKRVP